MSMISAQIDELRELAGDGSMEWVAGPIRASVLRDAADTIWELRESVHRERAEADKLREERDMYSDLVGMMDHPDLNAQLQAENAKLRELVADVHKALCLDKTTLFREAIIKSLEADMRELGIEVES